MKVVVWHSDFKVFEGLSARLLNFVRSGDVEIVRFGTNFIEVYGDEHILEALYNPKGLKGEVG